MVGCAGVFQASSAIFYPEQTSFPGGVAPNDFVIVAEDRSRSEPFYPVFWRNVPAFAAERPAALRLSVAEYDYVEGDPWGFKVTEQSPTHQVIEVSHRHFSGINTRYRVEGNRVTPLSYKNDGGMLHAMLLTPVFIVCLWLAWRAARWTSRTIRRRLDAGARSP